MTPADALATLAAPFFYVTQIERTQAMLTVPFERVGEMDPPARYLAPRFIFSMGRTGSTLLVRLFQALGIGSASEPDIFTQICELTEAQQAVLGPEMEAALLRASLISLARFAGPAPFIKLRNHCNRRPEALMRQPGARAILMLRHAEPWAISRYRAFDESPIVVAHHLRDSILAYEILLATGHPPTLIWFEDLVADPVRELGRLLDGFDLTNPFARASIAAVMARDSQEGTALARPSLKDTGDEAAFLKQFWIEWKALRGNTRLTQPGAELGLRLTS